MRAFVLFVLCLLPALVLAGPLSASLSPSVSLKARTGQNWHVRFTLTNTATTPVAVLKYSTPLQGITSAGLFAVFDVTNGESHPVTYTGMVVKRGEIASDDLMLLQAGETVSRDIDLSQGYIFEAGRVYRIETTAQVLMVNNAASTHEVVQQVRQNWNTFSVQDMRAVASDASQPHVTFTAGTDSVAPWLHSRNEQPSTMSMTPVGCSVQQSSSFAASLSAASNAVDAVNTFLRTRCTNSHYTRFFGSYNIERYQRVINHYSNIYSYLNRASPINIVCNSPMCDDNVFAFVYPNDDSKIYVCGAYWSASPVLSRDSRPGTLVHEISHFHSTASTQDISYGVTRAEALAASHPDSAVMNADSHEYFTEFLTNAGCA